MIGKNWMKALAVAGASAVVAAAMPAISEAKSHYTGKTPVGIAMMGTPSVTVPARFITAAKHTTITTTLKHKKLSTVSLKHKHHKVIKTAHVKKKIV